MIWTWSLWKIQRLTVDMIWLGKYQYRYLLPVESSIGDYDLYGQVPNKIAFAVHVGTK
jgi:hypothetical protein